MWRSECHTYGWAQYLGVQKQTRSGLNGVSERDIWKTNLPFSRLIKVLYLRGENCLQNAHFYKQKGPCLNFKNWTGSVFHSWNILGLFFVSLRVALDCTETPLLKPLFRGSWLKYYSETWETLQFWKKNSLGVKRPFSEQLSEFRGFLGAILGMAVTT